MLSSPFWSKKVISPASANDNNNYELQVRPGMDGLTVPVHGTVIRLVLISKKSPGGQRKAVPIVTGPSPNTFLALFEEDDVDFEVNIDNNESKSRDLSFRLAARDRKGNYVARKEESYNMETMETLGQKFHFLRKSHYNAECIIGQYATIHGLHYANAAKILGRLQFTKISFSDRHFPIFVRTFTGDMVTLDVTRTDRIKDLERKLYEKKGIVLVLGDHQLHLTFKGMVLQDQEKSLESYGIKKDSSLEIKMPVRGGMGQLLAKLSPNSKKSEPGMKDYGEPGIIVFSDRSQQRFVPADFSPDPLMRVKDFVIELRLKPTSVC